MSTERALVAGGLLACIIVAITTSLLLFENELDTTVVSDSLIDPLIQTDDHDHRNCLLYTSDAADEP